MNASNAPARALPLYWSSFRFPRGLVTAGHRARLFSCALGMYGQGYERPLTRLQTSLYLARELPGVRGLESAAWRVRCPSDAARIAFMDASTWRIEVGGTTILDGSPLTHFDIPTGDADMRLEWERLVRETEAGATNGRVQWASGGLPLGQGSFEVEVYTHADVHLPDDLEVRFTLAAFGSVF